MAAKEISPLRVWVLALVILVALGAALFMVLDDPLTLLADHRGFGTACRAVTTGGFMLPCCA